MVIYVPVRAHAPKAFSQEITLLEAIEEISKKYDVYFTFDMTLVSDIKVNYTKDGHNSADEAISRILKGTELAYKFYDQRFVIIYKNDAEGLESLKKMAHHIDDLISDGENAKITRRVKLIEKLSDKSIPLTLKRMELIVEGQVVDQSGEPLIGVNVLVKGTNNGTATDFNGNFSLQNVNENAVLVFSYIGYQSKETSIAGKSNITIILQEDSQTLDQVVVVGYGTQRKSSITGAISSVDAQDLENMPMTQLGQKLQGKLSGIRINQSTGTPGEGFSVRIRGQASINAGNSPLIVIDGFPSSIGLEAINPDEIESISVLKDASASSLYGSRAANGVILVTTKQAKVGKTDIRFSVYSGLQNVPQRGRPNVMNAQQFAQFKNEWYSDQGMEVPERYKNPSQYGPNDGTDWFDIFLNPNALLQNYNFSLSTGTESIQSSINASYNKQDGVMLNTFSERITARANNLFKVSDKLVFGLNLSANLRNSQNLNTDGTWSILSAGYIMDPTLEYKNEDGTYPISFSSPGMFPNPNWYRVLTERENPLARKNILVNAFGEYEILKGLSYKLKADADIGNSENRYWSPSTAQGSMFVAPPNPPAGSYNSSNYKNWQIENTLNYNLSINEDHNFQALLGYAAQKVRNESSSLTGSDFPDDEISWVTGASVIRGNVSTSEYSILSNFGRLNYNYSEKYFLSMAVRRDGSSRFGENKKYGIFPSLSVGWVVSKENFLNKYSNVLSFLKVRASYGEVGNYNIGNYSHLSSIGNANYVFNNSLVAGKTKTNLGNADLTWETTVQTDIGLDIGLFDDRVFILYDYYWKRTNGLLYGVDIPLASGFGNIQSNIGEFEFWGHEVSLETKNLVGKFSWSSNITFSLDRNIVNKLGTENTPIGGYRENVDFVRTEVGHPIGQFYGYVYDGVFMNQAELDQGPHIKAYGGSDVGSVRIKDLSGPDNIPDGFIDPVDDKTFIGDPNPDFIFGLTNHFTYRNFDLDIHLVGRVGGDLFMGELLWTENIDGVFNVSPEVVDRWRSVDNPGAGNIPRTNSNPLHRFNNSRLIFDGSYLAARNITLSYKLPISSGKVVKGGRVYISSQNTFMLTNYPGMNPEAGESGLNGLNEGRDFAHYPVPRVFTVGADFNF
ncbi:TonB-dependent receptor [Membranihabitans marinus]